MRPSYLFEQCMILSLPNHNAIQCFPADSTERMAGEDSVGGCWLVLVGLQAGRRLPRPLRRRLLPSPRVLPGNGFGWRRRAY